MPLSCDQIVCLEGRAILRPDRGQTSKPSRLVDWGVETGDVADQLPGSPISVKLLELTPRMLIYT